MEPATLPVPSRAFGRRWTPMQMAWVAFLGRWRWEWFCTLTFKEDVHPERADKLFRVWVSNLNRAIYGGNWHRHGPGLPWVRALEYQRRGVIHYHALLGGDRLVEQRRLSWMDEWERLGGGIARIEAIRTYGAVIAYCAKYTVKGGSVDVGGELGAQTWDSITAELRERLPV